MNIRAGLYFLDFKSGVVNSSIKIIGHTDSDGEEKTNLKLSVQRAEALKKMLSTDFGVEAARMQADGKGESTPTVPNTSEINKANNRRVEFIKL